MKTEIELKELVVGLSGLMSVSGRETFEQKKLLSLVGGFFDEQYADDVGNQVFVRYSGRAGAPKILIDTHFDEVGMYVDEIKEGGFLSFVNIGGLDTRILGAAEVIIYGDRQIYGVIASTPPHLQKPKDAEKPGGLRFLIDTGYTKEELESFVRVGTPVGLPKYTDLVGGSIAGKALTTRPVPPALLRHSRCRRTSWMCTLLGIRNPAGRGAAAGTYRSNPTTPWWSTSAMPGARHLKGRDTAFGGGGHNPRRPPTGG